MILWQDVLDLVMAGRTSNLVCPFCKAGQIKIVKRERTTRLVCEGCRQFLEGSFLDQTEE